MQPVAAHWMTLREAAEYVGPRRAGRPTTVDTIRDWCLKGLRGVVLRSQLRGGMRVTTAEWLEGFWEALEEARHPGKPEPTPSPSKRKREIAQAEARLRAKGVRV